MGLVASNPLVKKTIGIKYYPLKPEESWEHPAKPEREDDQVEGSVDFWIRKFSAADQLALSGEKDNDRRIYLAIQRSVFTEEGVPVFPSVEDAMGLDLVMFAQLMTAINEANPDTAKKSQPRTNGGVSSPSPSAAEPSRSGSKPSRKTS